MEVKSLGGTVGKNPPAKKGNTRHMEFRSTRLKIPWKGNAQPTPVFFPNSMGRGAFKAAVLGGHKEVGYN